MGALRVKDGVEFKRIAPAGFRLLSAIEETAEHLLYDLTITSGTDGAHSGPNDPHHRGEAYDVRSHDVPAEQRQALLEHVMWRLSSGLDDEPAPSSGGLITRLFFGWLENAGTDDEHFHFQLRHGATYPPAPHLSTP